MSVINQLAGAIVKLNAIAKIRKYKRIHEAPFYSNGHGGAWRT
jgi:hypothetical protein